ncbi:hypothetical protein O6H91_04G077900 [Diphasiastrum complanatum]|uniref:Uncharacterized protein n=1 Tax=Diphasiastrum complanatum TaxID=34168 RepID=A0ACC2DYI9_DIPCM|nr:hypothetical protein O6H91_04G077900 [Diphasiastrum complanatum]
MMSWRLALMWMLLLVIALALDWSTPGVAASAVTTDLMHRVVKKPETNGIVPSRLKVYQNFKKQQVEHLDSRCSSVARKMQTPCADIPLDLRDYAPPVHNNSPPSAAPGVP